MSMSEKDKIISFESVFDELDKEIKSTDSATREAEEDILSTSGELKDLFDSLGEIPGSIRIVETHQDDDVKELDECIYEIIEPRFRSGVKLTATDVMVSIVAGAIAAVIDIALVGTPEVVKIYKGGENFDGSVITKALRSVGNGNDKFSELLKWFSDKCKVSYDISAAKDIVVPDNHRLRNFAHDPLMGMLFAVADIIMGTATLVDNNGHLRVLVNPRDYPLSEKYLSVVFYFGHLISDVCTARGIPVPGMILTQFFRDGIDDKNSIGAVVEQMYKDGYDLRHLVSMSTPVVVKNLILELYIRFFKSTEETGLQTIAKKEISAQQKEAYKYRLILISDAVSCGGNVVKFFIPPTMGNVTALNLPEWCSLLKNTIYEMRYQLRDKSVEKAIYNRDVINQNWMVLLEATKRNEDTQDKLNNGIPLDMS